MESAGQVAVAREPSLLERLRNDLVNLRCGVNDLNLNLGSMRSRLLQDTPPSVVDPTRGSATNKLGEGAISFMDIAAEVERIGHELREAQGHFSAIRKIG